jgi:hypothetical protein
VITEVATTEEGGDKAGWIHQLFTLASERHVRALVWFVVAKEADWRIDSSSAAAAAFRTEAAVRGRLGPAPIPDCFRSYQRLKGWGLC